MNCWEYANSIPGMNGRGGMIAPRMLNLVEEGNHYVLQSKVHCNIENYMEENPHSFIVSNLNLIR